LHDHVNLSDSINDRDTLTGNSMVKLISIRKRFVSFNENMFSFFFMSMTDVTTAVYTKSQVGKKINVLKTDVLKSHRVDRVNMCLFMLGFFFSLIV
jgi:hypothetical protein